ncbi:DUF3040 domain-containing protein [Pseudonocardia sp. CA-107938]|uniref:DUF3040 domain-containing protein n=1 Tax=Pseudonocardia sp. CA-107938 TaxID=3240021 RepID=UPI003D8A31EF
MLSERDHRILGEIEQEFARSSPRLARRLRCRTGNAQRFLYDATALVAGSAAQLCLLVARQGTGGAALAAAALTLGILAARHRRFPYRSRTAAAQEWPRGPGRGLARS